MFVNDIIHARGDRGALKYEIDDVERMWDFKVVQNVMISFMNKTAPKRKNKVYDLCLNIHALPKKCP